MCELFGLSSRVPTTVSLSVRLLARRGSHASGLGDGWGVAYHMGDDALVAKQPGPADASPWIDFLAGQPIRSRIVVSHIRHATQGEVSLRNTQPFMRELGGRMHVFAHNGRLSGIERRFAGGSRRFRPVGTTDSEVAFCALLERLAPLWDAGTPSPEQRLREVADVAATLRALGPANFLYADGELLVAHAHRRTQRDGSIAPPGLWMLHRSCAVDPDALASAGVTLDGGQLVTLFASVPLTEEPWQPLREGEIAVARDGVGERGG
ncbi:MAG TPA: class II glutamine amidotransferase [Acetobacteraceae bacterium]|nr:class II glutamine amidotransferase [Acetobacteraceae bacterium]